MLVLVPLLLPVRVLGRGCPCPACPVVGVGGSGRGRSAPPDV